MLWPAVLVPQAIHVAAQLGIADLVHSAPRTLAELASLTHTHEPSLGRILRALTTIGVFVENPADCFQQSEVSDLLRADHPHSLRARAVMLGAGFVSRPLRDLEASIRTGQSAFEHCFGEPLFDYLDKHPNDCAVFDVGIGGSSGAMEALAGAADFARFKLIVDVGGGKGELIAAILRAHRGARGILFDRPHVLRAVTPTCDSVKQRLTIVPGDFREFVPAGGDAYVLSHVLHNWDDASAMRILQKCRSGIMPGGRLFVVETVLRPPNHSAHAFMDVMLMILTGGRERSEPEFRRLLEGAGFSLVNVVPLVGGSLLESRPV
jgi:hypothetical protein